jgi:hypothetical protein
VLRISAAGSGGAKYAVSGTATATSIIYDDIIYNSAGIVSRSRHTTLNDPSAASSLLEPDLIVVEGLITINAGGTLTVQFAQDTVDAAASTVLAGSLFGVERVT